MRIPYLGSLTPSEWKWMCSRDVGHVHQHGAACPAEGTFQPLLNVPRRFTAPSSGCSRVRVRWKGYQQPGLPSLYYYVRDSNVGAAEGMWSREIAACQSYVVKEFIPGSNKWGVDSITIRSPPNVPIHGELRAAGTWRLSLFEKQQLVALIRRGYPVKGKKRKV
ncbi:hypothetical protein VUR80DRAFT_1654 [Thermomyces stellatus]